MIWKYRTLVKMSADMSADASADALCRRRIQNYPILILHFASEDASADVSAEKYWKMSAIVGYLGHIWTPDPFLWSPAPPPWALMWHFARRGLYHCLMPDYTHRCRTSTLIMVPINFWRNSDLFKKKEHFSSSKIDRVRVFLVNLSNFR